MFDPNQDRLSCETYLSSSLGCRVEFVRAIQVTQSSRTAPWRLEVMVNGTEQSYVLQLDPRNMTQEFQVLEAMQATAIPTPRVYGLDLQGKSLGVPCFFSDFIAGEPLLTPVLAGETWAEHDVTIKVEGLAANELDLVLYQRWADLKRNDLQPADPFEAPPAASSMTNVKQIIQVARTVPTDAQRLLETDLYSFAVNGDYTIWETLKKAVGQAKNYIYIEDFELNIEGFFNSVIESREGKVLIAKINSIGTKFNEDGACVAKLPLPSSLSSRIRVQLLPQSPDILTISESL